MGKPMSPVVVQSMQGDPPGYVNETIVTYDNGLYAGDVSGNGSSPQQLVYDSKTNLLYSSSGLVLDPSNDSVVGYLGSSFGQIAYDSQNGYMYASYEYSGVIAVINPISDAVLATMSVPNQGLSPEVTSMAFDPVSGYLYVGYHYYFGSQSGDGVSVIAPSQGDAMVANLTGFNDPFRMAVDTSDGLVYVANNAYSQTFVSVINGTSELHPNPFNLDGPGNQIDGLAYDPQSNLVYGSYVTQANESLFAINSSSTVSTSLISSSSSSSPAPQLVFDAGELYTTNSSANDQLIEINATSKSVSTLEESFPLTGYLMEDPQNGYLYLSSQSAVLAVDPSTNHQVGIILTSSSPYGEAYSQADGYLYVSDSQNGLIDVVDTATNRIVSTISVSPCLWGQRCTLGSLAYNQNDNLLYVAATNESTGLGIIYTIAASNGSIISSVSVQGGLVSMTYDPSDNELYFDYYSPSSSQYFIASLDSSGISIIGPPQSSLSYGIIYDSANKLLYINGGQDPIVALNTTSGSIAHVVAPMSASNYLAGLTLDTNNGDLLAVTNQNICGGSFCDNYTIYEIDPTTNATVGTFVISGNDQSLSNVLYDPSNDYVYLSTGSVTVVDASNGHTVGILATGASPEAMVYVPSNSNIYLTNGRGSTVSVLSASSDQPKTNVVFNESGFPTGTAWGVTFEGKTVYTSNSSSISFTNVWSVPVSSLQQTILYSWNATESASCGTGCRLQAFYAGTQLAGAQNLFLPYQEPSFSISYLEQYLVAFGSSPPQGGVTDPAGASWLDSGSNIAISAYPAYSGNSQEYNFTRWSTTNTAGISFLNPSSQFTNATINGPGNVTANFAINSFNVTFFESGLPRDKEWTLTFNGQSYSSTSNMIVVTPTAGSYQWSVASIIPGTTGTRYLAERPSGTISVPSSLFVNVTYVAQYLLTVSVNKAGAGNVSLSPQSPGDWYNSTDTVNLSATAMGSYSFSSWSGSGMGSYTGQDDPTYVTMDSPVTETANFNTTVNIALSSSFASIQEGKSAALTVTIFGVPQSVNLTVSGLPNGANATWQYNPVTDTDAGVTDVLNITTSLSTLTGTYPIEIVATGNSQDEAGGAVFTLQVYGFNVNFTESGLPIGTKWGVSFGDQNYYSTNSVVTIQNVSATWYLWNASTPVLGAAQGVRYVVEYGSQESGNMTVPTQTSQFVGYETQYQVSFESSPSDEGTTTPQSGSYWYNASSTISIQASASSTQHVFSHWQSGSSALLFADPSTPSTQITVDGAGTITAIFQSSSFTVTLSSVSGTGAIGSTLYSNVTVKGVSGVVTLSAGIAPIGVSSSLNPDIITLTSAQGNTSKFTVSIDSNAIYGQYLLTISATDQKGDVATATYALTIPSYTLTFKANPPLRYLASSPYSNTLYYNDYGTFILTAGTKYTMTVAAENFTGFGDLFYTPVAGWNFTGWAGSGAGSYTGVGNLSESQYEFCPVVGGECSSFQNVTTSSTITVTVNGDIVETANYAMVGAVPYSSLNATIGPTPQSPYPGQVCPSNPDFGSSEGNYDCAFLPGSNGFLYIYPVDDLGLCQPYYNETVQELDSTICKIPMTIYSIAVKSPSGAVYYDKSIGSNGLTLNYTEWWVGNYGHTNISSIYIYASNFTGLSTMQQGYYTITISGTSVGSEPSCYDSPNVPNPCSFEISTLSTVGLTESGLPQGDYWVESGDGSTINSVTNSISATALSYDWNGHLANWTIGDVAGGAPNQILYIPSQTSFHIPIPGSASVTYNPYYMLEEFTYGPPIVSSCGGGCAHYIFGGTVSIKPQAPFGGPFPANPVYFQPGTTVTLTAQPYNSSYVFLYWRGTGPGSYTGTEKTITITMNGPIEEQAYFGLQQSNVTFIETGLPPGTSWGVTLDGKTQSSTSQELTLTGVEQGTSSWDASSPSCGTDCRFEPFPASGDVTLSSSAQSTTVYINYVKQFYLTMKGDPVDAGEITPSSGWFNSSSTVGINVTGTYGAYTLVSWFGVGNGSYSGPNYEENITMNSPITETAHFTYYAVFVESGLPDQTQWTVNVDGKNYSGFTDLSQQVNYIAVDNLSATTHIWTVVTPDSGCNSLNASGTTCGEVRYVTSVVSGTDDPTSGHVEFDIPFSTQYQVSVEQEPQTGATITPNGTGWYYANDTVTLSVQPNVTSPLQFSFWNSSTSAIAIPDSELLTTDAVIGGPGNITAVFGKIVASVTFVETGLPSGTFWNITFGYNSQRRYNSTTDTITVTNVTEGLHQWFAVSAVKAANGIKYLSYPEEGNVSVPYESRVTVAFVPDAVWDEQMGETFVQNFTSLSYNVTAVNQNDQYGYGPAYLLNGLSNVGFWYQVGLEWNWPNPAGGGSFKGFGMGIDVFNATGGLVSVGKADFNFTGPVSPGDKVLLSLSFVDGNVSMYAYDWNTKAHANYTYYAFDATEFVGDPTGIANRNGVFTGLMTEWYHVLPFYGDIKPVAYTSNENISSAWSWVDEFNSDNGTVVFANQTTSAIVLTQGKTVGFSWYGATLISSANEFITGSALVPTAVSLVCAPSSIALNSTSKCTARVSGSSPTGTVTFSLQSGSTGNLTFSSETCALSSGACSATVTGSSLGMVGVKASYSGDSLNANSSGSFELAVNIVASSYATTTLSGGVASSNQTSATDVSVDITGSSAANGTMVTISTDDLSSPGPGIGSVTLNDARYYDVKVSGISDGTARICIEDTEANSNAVMEYWNGTSWLGASNMVVSGGTACGDIPVAALTGTNIVVGNPVPSVPPSDTYTVTFTESGLSQGTTWSVTLGGDTLSSATDSISFYQFPQGTYLWIVASPLPGGQGVRYAVTSPSSGSMSVPSQTSETITFATQYEVSIGTSPSAGGAASPSGTSWHDAGSSFQIVATPANGYEFSSWSTSTGSISLADATSPSTTAEINGPGTITADFVLVSTTTTSTTTTTTASTATTTTTSTATTPTAPSPSTISTTTSQTMQSSSTTSSTTTTAAPPPTVSYTTILVPIIVVVLIASAVLALAKRRGTSGYLVRR
jgi:hypothetical protein